MKRNKLGTEIFYCLMAAIGGVLVASLFAGCHIYTDEEIETIRCTQIRDTVRIPEWELTE